MSRVRAILVDDEPLALSNLRVLLRLDAEIEIVAECGLGAEAVAEIRKRQPDLVFLDVQMPETDGFDVLEMLGADLPLAVVFVTAYDRYALRAFEAGALDYLLKPFDDARFHRALKRAKERIAHARKQPRQAGRLAVKSAGAVLFLEISEIDWIEASDYYSCLHVGAKTHLLRRSIAELDDLLDQKLFCRIHRSTIVQLDRIRALQVNASGEYDALLTDGTNVRLSRRYRKQLQSRMTGLLERGQGS